MSFRTLLEGRAYSFNYPRHNFEHVPTMLEPRRVLVESVRDLESYPLEKESVDINPFVRRGRWLIKGRDLDKHAERQFYVASMVGVIEIDASAPDEQIPIWIVGTMRFATEHEAVQAAAAKARIARRDVAISVSTASFANRRIVKLISSGSKLAFRRISRRKSA